MANQKLQVSLLNFKEICRTCSSRGELLSIFSKNNDSDDDGTIKNMLQEIANIEAVENDKLPQQICKKCYKKLKQASEFIKQCQKNDTKLQSLANSEFVPVVIEGLILNSGSSRAFLNENNPFSIKEESVTEDDEEVEEEDRVDEIVEDKEIEEYDYYRESEQDPDDPDQNGEEHYQTIEVINENEEMAEGTIIQILSPSQLTEQLFDEDLIIKPENDVISEVEPCMCQICGAVFNFEKNLIVHMKNHHPDDVTEVETDHGEDDETNLVCNKCDLNFRSIQQYRQHKVDHVLESRIEINENGEVIYICGICNRRFPSKHGLSIHQAFHTNRKLDVEVDKPYGCTICDKTFATMKAMRNHRKAHGSKQYICSICNKIFSIKARLQIHVRTHTGEKPYSCPECGKRFGNTTSLRIHDLIHSGARPHYCKMCGRRFKQHSHLKNHLLTHSGVRPFQCSICAKTFVFKGNLTVHMRMHSGETPYICTVCGKGFYDSSRMKKHRKTHDKTFMLVAPTTTQ